VFIGTWAEGTGVGVGSGWVEDRALDVTEGFSPGIGILDVGLMISLRAGYFWWGFCGRGVLASI